MLVLSGVAASAPGGWQHARIVIPRGYPMTFASTSTTALLSTLSQYAGGERAAVLAPGQTKWRPERLPAPSTSGPSIVALPDGRFLAVWHDDATATLVASVRSQSGQWSAPVPTGLDFPGGDEPDAPAYLALVATPTGAALAASHADTPGGRITSLLAARFDAAADGWSAPATVASFPAAGFPTDLQLAVAGSGLLTAFWRFTPTSGRGSQIRVSDESAPDAWEPSGLLARTSADFAAGESADGSALVLVPGARRVTFVTRHGRGSWSTHPLNRGTFGPAVSERWIPGVVYAVVAAGPGSLLAVWAEIQSKPRISRAVTLRFSAHGLTAPRVLETTDATMEGAAAASSGGRVIVAFSGFGGTPRPGETNVPAWVDTATSSNEGVTFTQLTRVDDRHEGDEHRRLRVGVGPHGMDMVAVGYEAGPHVEMATLIATRFR